MHDSRQVRPSLALGPRWLAPILVLLLSLAMGGCRPDLEESAAVAHPLGRKIEKKTKDAEMARVRMDHEPRPDSSRSAMEDQAIRLANEAIGRGRARVKEAYCGFPSDLPELDPEVFGLTEESFIPSDPLSDCRAALEGRYPALSPCYLVFDNGSSGVINCYEANEANTFSCMSVSRLFVALTMNLELRRVCARKG